MYSAFVVLSVLYMSIRFCWLIVLLISSISFFIFFLVSLSASGKRFLELLGNYLKFSTIIVNLSTSPFNSLSFWFLYCQALLFGEYAFRIVMSSCCIVTYAII